MSVPLSHWLSQMAYHGQVASVKFSSYIKVRKGAPYFRMAVPADVRRLVGGKVRKEISFRLPTNSVGEANRTAAALADYCAGVFDDVRQRLRPVPLQPLTDRAVEMLKPVIEAATRQLVLGQDDKLRDHAIAQVGQVLSFSAEHHLPLPTTSAQFVEQCRAWLDSQVAQMALDRTAQPAAATAEMMIGSLLGASGFELKMTSEETQQLLRIARDAVLSAYRDLQLRYHGYAVPTPSQAEVNAIVARANGESITDGESAPDADVEGDPSLEAIFQFWKARRGTNPKTVDDYRGTMRSLALFVHPDKSEMPLTTCRASEITVPLMQRYIAHLSTEPFRNGKPRLARSVKVKVAELKAMFRLAKTQGLLLGEDSTRELVVETPKNAPKSRKAFSPESERLVLTHPVFARRELPSDPDAGGAAAYWIPLIMWKSGVRPNELCQAAASNVKITQLATAQQIAYLEINNEDGRRTKNGPSNRFVPVHDDLIALGFLDYWKGLPQEGYLFPDLITDRYGRSERFSEWFNQKLLRGELGVSDPKQVLYSFRHGFITKCRDAEMADSTRLSIVGHSGKNPVDDGYGDEVFIGTKHAALMHVLFERYPIAHW